MASRRGDLEGARLLLAARSSALARADDGNLPVHLASVSGHPDVVSLLLDHAGPEQLRVRNRLGQLPAEAAADVRTAQLFRRNARCEGGGAPAAAEDRYAERTSSGDGSVLLRNARADHVGRLLGRPRCPPALGPGKAQKPAPKPQRCETPQSGDQSSPRVHAPFVRMRDGSPEAEMIGPHSFDLLQLLGRGSFGEVFHVKHKQTQQSYAMKVIRKVRLRSRNMLRYTLTERNILAYVRHPYIVSLHYAFQTASHLVLVMQFCPRGNLQELISRERCLQESAARLYASEILLAICHMHARQTIFRDLKPENVVIDGENHALLTDFGLSKEGVRGLHGAKSFCGSLAFLAPEILLRRRHGHTVDIYNLGVLLFDMLTGRPPFFHPDPVKLFENIKHSCLEVPEYVPEAAQSLILATMEREPSRRLGAVHTADVKAHPFFSSVDFGALMRREVQAPELSTPRAANPQRSPRRAPALRSPFAHADQAIKMRSGRVCSADSIESGQPVLGWEFATV
mmetsp:Transcript_172459/g.419458  ORF Transcript_172459/g.419458 Transcript_172459/m.419458 type:complete len:512 (-) Transcript_172459:580-2115(-)